MKFSIAREALLKPLNLVAGVVERRQTLPVLANVLIVLEGDQLSITGTDLEVELVGRVTLPEPAAVGGEITVPARKLVDICKSLPEGAQIDFTLDGQRLVVRSGRSRFALSTLAASEFPSVEQKPGDLNFRVRQGDVKRLIERTAFAMAQQDVRYYLNGMLWEVRPQHLRAVATDGHRLAMCTLALAAGVSESVQVILPRKGVIELSRLLQDENAEIEISIGASHFRALTGEFSFSSKLVDGKFPDYERVLPRASHRTLLADRDTLRQAFQRASILSNEKYRGIRLMLAGEQARIIASNPEQEEAEEELLVSYDGEPLEIGFNVSYLLDVLGVLKESEVRIRLGDANSSALLEEAGGGDSAYVVMPMRL